MRGAGCGVGWGVGSGVHGVCHGEDGQQRWLSSVCVVKYYGVGNGAVLQEGVMVRGGRGVGSVPGAVRKCEGWG